MLFDDGRMISFLAVDVDPRQRPHEGLQGQPHRRPRHARLTVRRTPGWASNAFVVVVGFLILSGAVNTAIIGSNGVLNRVAEDGVVPDWFLKPHPQPRHGLPPPHLIVGLQLFTILASRGDMLIHRPRPCAFGVVRKGFVFKAAAMVVLQLEDRSPARPTKVPFNVRIGGVEF